MTKLPYFDRSMKPDFLAPGPKVKVGTVDGTLDVTSDGLLTFVDIEKDPLDPVSALDPEQRPTTYYESNKILGKLYRLIDEKGFYDSLRVYSQGANLEDTTTPTTMGTLWQYVQTVTEGIQHESYLDVAKDIKDNYEYNIKDMMHRFSLHPSFPLHEIEVVSGCILGSVLVRRLKEMVTDMRESFADDVAYTRNRIRMNEEGSSDEALPRAIACLAVAMKEPGLKMGKDARLLSFRYVAAAVCLEEIECFHGRLLRRL
jgi:hypothetical protein